MVVHGLKGVLDALKISNVNKGRGDSITYVSRLNGSNLFSLHQQ
jgi:hypothetical protein